MSVAQLVHGIGVVLLVAACATANGVMVASLIPQWSRIVRLALGEIEPEAGMSDRISHHAKDGGRGQHLQTEGHS